MIKCMQKKKRLWSCALNTSQANTCVATSHDEQPADASHEDPKTRANDVLVCICVYLLEAGEQRLSLLNNGGDTLQIVRRGVALRLRVGLALQRLV